MKVFGKPTLKELYELSKDNTVSIGSTPFGADLDKGERRQYIKKAAPWKGVKGIENIRRINPKVADTVEKLAEASKALSGIKGVVYVVKDGKMTAMPKKSFLAAKAKNPSLQVITEYKPAPTLSIDEYVSKVKALAKV